MRVGLFLFTALFLFLLLLSGCFEEKKLFEARNDCIVLSQNSASSIPDCSSQEECFNSVEKNFFSFDQSIFSFNSNRRLHEFKNHLAASWLYFNKALKEIKTINSLCSSGSTEILPSHVNELNFFLSNSLQEYDSSMKDSIAFVELESDSLDGEKISLVKEEALFDDFILFNNELNELGQKSISFDANSFASQYKLKASELSAFFSENGFKSDYLQEFNSYDLLDFMEKRTVENIQSKNIFVPVMKLAFSGIISFLERQDEFARTIKILRSMPAFSLMEFYDSVAGSRNSVAASFALLVQNDALHRSQLQQKSSALESELNKKFTEIDDKLNSQDLSFFEGLNQNFLSSLNDSFVSSFISSSEEASFSDLGSFKSDSSAKLSELKQDFFSLQQGFFLGRISLPEKLSKLKALSLSVNQFNSKIDFFSSDAVNGLIALCDARINSIAGTKVPEGQKDSIELLDLKARLDFRVLEYRNSSEPKDKIFFCFQVLASFTRFDSASKDFSSFQAANSMKSKDCFDFLDRAFSSGLDLSNFLEGFNQLKELKADTSIDPSVLAGQCSGLESSVESFLFSENEAIARINSNYSEASKLMSLTESNSFPQKENFANVFSSLSKYFSEGKLNLNNSIGSLDEVDSLLSSFASNLEGFVSEQIQKKVSEKAEFFFSGVPEIELNKPFSARARLSLNNNFSFSISKPLTLGIPFDYPDSQIILVSFSFNVIAARVKDNAILIDLNSLPEGLTLMEFDLNKMVLSSEEKEELLFSDQFKAVVEKKVSFNSKPLASRVRLSVELGEKAFDLFAFFNGKSIPFSFYSGKAFFLLEGLKGNDSMLLYYSLPEPISLQLSLSSQQKTDSNSQSILYDLIVGNNSSFSFDSVNLVLPLDFDSKNIKQASLYSSDGIEIKTKVLSNNSLSFSSGKILPGQARNYSLKILIENQKDYWLSFRQKLEGDLGELLLSSNNKISLKAKELEGEFNSISFSGYSSDSEIKSLTELREKTNDLLSLNNSSVNSRLSFDELKNSIKSKLDEAGQNIQFLKDSNFFSQASSLKEKSVKAMQLLGEAESIFASSEKESFNLLFEAKSLLEGSEIQPLAKLIGSKQKELKDSLRKILSSDFFQQELSPLKNEFLFLDEGLSFALAENDLNKAQKSLLELGSRASDLNSSFMELASKKLSGLKEKIKGLTENSKTKKLLESFNKLFSGGIPKNYVLPLTKSRLEKIKLKLDSLQQDLSFDSKFQEFLEAVDSNDFEKALSKASSVESKLNKENSKFSVLEQELDSAFNKIREDSFAELETAAKLQENYGSKESEVLLSKARKTFNSNNFFDSINFSRQARNAMGKPQSFLPIVALVPLAAIALIFCFMKFRRPNNRTKEEEKVKLRRLPKKD
ncbi:MAG: hypothetical protein AB1467_04425 [Candidatus Diapherotrites archaeon]